MRSETVSSTRNESVLPFHGRGGAAARQGASIRSRRGNTGCRSVSPSPLRSFRAIERPSWREGSMIAEVASPSPDDSLFLEPPFIESVPPSLPFPPEREFPILPADRRRIRSVPWPIIGKRPGSSFRWLLRSSHGSPVISLPGRRPCGSDLPPPSSGCWRPCTREMRWSEVASR